ncbi:MAG: hypothetical protein HUJ29_01695 [Gammaproteobacteria bacterium]|nr:hypothetical protein [Gammaproteobacteria bacterium]
MAAIMSVETNGDASAISLEEMTRMRQAVYTALLPFFETNALLEAIWLWEEEYATVDDVLIRRFVQEVCTGEMTIMVNSVQHNLMAHINDGEAPLEDDPYRLMVAYRAGHVDTSSPASTAPESPTENMQLFQTLLTNMNRMLEAENRYSAYLVRNYADEALAEYRGSMSISQINELRNWMQNNGGDLRHHYSAKQMSSVLHLVYTGACAYFGPKLANDIHGMTIKSVEGAGAVDDIMAESAEE